MEPSAFDIEKFLALSRQLDLSGIDLDAAANYPLNESEVRILRYMQDTELYTVHYMMALLATSALADSEARAFLINWGYEECYHGRALAKFLEKAGHAASKRSTDEFAKPRRWLEVVQDLASRAASIVSRDFVAVHMTWGAINELTACYAYDALAEKSKNPVLVQIIRRIIKDERRHFAFYYQQAERRLAVPFAKKLVKFGLTRFWTPVGGTMNPETQDYVGAYLFGDPDGPRRLDEVDATIRKLPGMDWFNLVSKETLAGNERIRKAGVPVVGLATAVA